MECRIPISEAFHECPFQENQFSRKLTISPLIFLIFQLLISATNPVSSQSWDGIIVTEADYQSLQAFKHELIDPKGFLKSWNDTGSGACSGKWEGIKCAKGQVIVIQLPWRGLSGRITEKIGQFQGLRKLSLHDNFITGLIPISLGFLPNLRGIQLFSNRFTGSIPSSLGSCPLLQTLDLGSNLLYGAIPENLANLTNLFRLNLSYNGLTGPITVGVTQSASLMFLDLERNNLSGAILSFGGGNGKNVFQEILLSHNQLSGVIPTGIGNLYGLRKLDFSYNFIDGEIPSFLGELPNLESFNVSYNNLSGSVPSKLSKKFNPSSFIGNFQLCGYSSSTPCSNSPYQTPLNSRKTSRKLSVKDVILILAGVLLVILLIICCILFCCLLKKRKTAKEDKTSRGEKGISPASSEVEANRETGGKLVHFDGSMVFSVDDLLCATAETMGKSTYGTVFKASMEDGIEVAVKRLREKITKGQREFEAEINVLGKIRHPNLLAIRGYYLGPKGEKLIVLDYMAKGSLANFLHARSPNTPIDWPTRMNIAKGITRGLLYLHTNANTIHGNLTSSNVLLDEHTNPKIADYGLSNLMIDAAYSNAITTLGELGYRAPEFSKMKKSTAKTDIYSLGVIILELLTGKSAGEFSGGLDLPNWVASVVEEEWTNEVFDLDLVRENLGIGDELLNTLKLALNCVDSSPAVRPEAQMILEQLEEIVRPETATCSSGDDY